MSSGGSENELLSGMSSIQQLVLLTIHYVQIIQMAFWHQFRVIVSRHVSLLLLCIFRGTFLRRTLLVLFNTLPFQPQSTQDRRRRESRRNQEDLP